MNCLWILVLLFCCGNNRSSAGNCGCTDNSCIQPRNQRRDRDCGCDNNSGRDRDCGCDNNSGRDNNGCGCDNNSGRDNGCGCENEYRERVRAPFSPDDGDCGCGR